MERSRRQLFALFINTDHVSDRLVSRQSGQPISTTSYGRKRFVRILIATAVGLALRIKGIKYPLGKSTEYDLAVFELETPVPAPADTHIPQPTDTPTLTPINTPAIPTKTPTNQLHTSSAVEVYTRQKAVEAGINPQRLVNLIGCESTFNPAAVSADRRYHGLLQYDDRTWKEALTIYQQRHGLPYADIARLNIYNPVDHINVSIEFIKRVNFSRWPNC